MTDIPFSLARFLVISFMPLGTASEKGTSVNAYLQDLVRKDQEGMFDTMQIADRNMEQIAGIQGNMHDGYDVIFKDGYQIHCRTKKDVRAGIIEYCKEKWV